MIRRALTVLLALFASSAAAQVVEHAGEPGHTVRYQSCIAAPPARADAGRLACIEDELAIQEARLAKVERQELQRVPFAQHDSLALGMRMWRANRDAECARSGDGGALAVAQCRLDQTVQRLMAMYSRPGG